MAVTIHELINAIPAEKIRMQNVNQSVMQVNMSQKKKPANITIAVEDQVAQSFLLKESDPVLLIMLDREAYLEACKKLGISV